MVVAAHTDNTSGSGDFSLFVMDRDTAGFERGRKLGKFGLPGQDTAELFFHDAVVPEANLLGEPGLVGTGLQRRRIDTGGCRQRRVVCQ